MTHDELDIPLVDMIAFDNINSRLDVVNEQRRLLSVEGFRGGRNAQVNFMLDVEISTLTNQINTIINKQRFNKQKDFLLERSRMFD